jgi:hypothetical protein
MHEARNHAFFSAAKTDGSSSSGDEASEISTASRGLMDGVSPGFSKH